MASNVGRVQPQPAADPEIIELVQVRAKFAVVLGTVITLFFGVIAIRGAIIGSDQPLSTTARIFAAVLGLFFTGLGLLFLSRWPQLLFGNRALIVGSNGIALRDRFAPTFMVAWPEIQAIRLTYGTRRTRAGRRILVRLDWWPSAPPPPALPRALARIWHRPATPDRFRLPLGPNPQLIEPVDRALQHFAGDRYRSVEDGGRIQGWQLT